MAKNKSNNNNRINKSEIEDNMAKGNRVRLQAKKSKRSLSAPAAFGPISTINTAPVSVGNSVRGSAPRVTQTSDGARVVSRDFAFALSASYSAITGWELIGGMPITPAVLPSSILRNYCQMFNKFKVNSLTFHYITSSPTSQAGDVMFYFEKDRLAPLCDYSSSSFLPFVLSDPHTVIGPQWTNHSIILKPTRDWKSTLYGNQTDINEDAEGTMFFFSKTNAANSPGYLLIDYDITFKELSVNPRAGTLPISRGQSTFICLNNTGTTTTANSAAAWNINTGKNIANSTSALPTGAITGDIYKCVLQITASTLVNAAWAGSTTPTVSNMLQYGTTNRAITLDDGFTCYMSWNASSTVGLFPTLESAVANADSLEWQASWTAVSINICAEIQLVRNVTDLTQSAY